MRFVDAAIGQMVAELRARGLFESTAIIVTAKHGQSPVDPHRFFPIPGHSGTNGTPPSALLSRPSSRRPRPGGIGPTEDDISLLWLTHSRDTGAAVDVLESNASGRRHRSDLLWSVARNDVQPARSTRDGGDPRTPDIIVQPNVGVVYTGSLKKQAEHGGFAHDDTNVMLLVSNPACVRGR